MIDITVFDNMVDDLLQGDHLVAEFDSKITIDVDLESISITYADDDELVEIIVDGEEIDFLHLFLEALFVARKQIQDINWDDLLIKP